MRDAEQARLTDVAYSEALRLITKHRAAARPGRDCAAREGDARREELLEIFGDVEPESRASETVGVVRALNAEPGA